MQSNTLYFSQNLHSFFKMKMKVFFFFLLVGPCLLYQGVSGVDPERESVSVKEGDPVTLHTGVKKPQHEITWYFNGIRIAYINGDPSKTCADVHCKGGDERFRGRLKLDHQTGSLTIRNINTTDTGDYKLFITKDNIDREKIFSVSVRGVSAADRDEVKRTSVKEGESVTLDPDIINPNGVMTWRFNDTLIAEITGDRSQICTDVQCKGGDGRFRDRLKLDRLNGSLTITNTRTTDSGLYELKITNSRFSRRRRSISGVNRIEVTVTPSGPSPGSGPSPASGPSGVAVAGIAVAAVLAVFAVAVVGVIYYRRRSFRNDDSESNSDDPVRRPIHKTEAAEQN